MKPKHRVPLAAVIWVVGALIAGAAVSTLLYFELERARASEVAAKERLALVTERLQKVIQLADVKRLANLKREEETLWPAYPERVPAMRTWLGESRDLANRLEDYRRELAALRNNARSETAGAGGPDGVASSDELQVLSSERAGKLRELSKYGARTRLAYGDDPREKHITYYFRHAFDSRPALPNGVDSLELRLYTTCGAVVYLNGSEIVRMHLPSGPVDSKTLAEGSPPDWFSAYSVDATHLVGGRNLLAVEAHLVDPSQAAMLLSLDLLLNGETSLSPIDAVWRYDDRGVDLGTAWKKTDYDDSAWKTGPAPFGYGVEGAKHGPRAAVLTEQIAALDERIRSLRNGTRIRSALRFADTELEWQHDTLAELVDALTIFKDPDPSIGLIANVESRLAFAQAVDRRSIHDQRATWDAAIASIASVEQCPMYDALVIKEQIGLVPIGRDPESGLWEFSHIQTGEVAKRDGNGRIAVREEMGLVFVLLPGRTFDMGSRSPTDEQPMGSPNVDPDSVWIESPVHKVTLKPFFLSKFEMTQGQWLRFEGVNPSVYLPGHVAGGHKHSLFHPVEGVSWVDCDRTLRHLGLALPTEAQWEYAARAGTTTIRWTGDDRESLRGAVNLADSAARRAGATWSAIRDWPELDDGYFLHAPIGTYAANPFGLHELLGNVAEWCRDRYGFYESPVHPEDGERMEIFDANSRMARGAAYNGRVTHARSARRSVHKPDSRQPEIGVRPARALTP